jgi:hypothetical protein
MSRPAPSHFARRLPTPAPAHLLPPPRREALDGETALLRRLPDAPGPFALRPGLHRLPAWVRGQIQAPIARPGLQLGRLQAPSNEPAGWLAEVWEVPSGRHLRVWLRADDQAGGDAPTEGAPVHIWTWDEPGSGSDPVRGRCAWRVAWPPGWRARLRRALRA